MFLKTIHPLNSIKLKKNAPSSRAYSFQQSFLQMTFAHFQDQL